jgi:hypothetical protein
MKALVAKGQRVRGCLTGLAAVCVAALVVGAATRDFGAPILIAVIVLGLGGVYIFTVKRGARADLSAGTYVRAKGAIAISYSSDQPDSIITPDGHRIPIDDDLTKTLRKMRPQTGEVDYIPNSDVLVEIRDSTGAVVWRNKNLH